jgi:hypothetical protein
VDRPKAKVGCGRNDTATDDTSTWCAAEAAEASTEFWRLKLGADKQVGVEEGGRGHHSEASRHKAMEYDDSGVETDDISRRASSATTPHPQLSW